MGFRSIRTHLATTPPVFLWSFVTCLAAVTKRQAKAIQRREGLFGMQFERIIHSDGKAVRQEPEAAGHVACTVMAQRTVSVVAQFTLCSLFSPGPQSIERHCRHPSWVLHWLT